MDGHAQNVGNDHQLVIGHKPCAQFNAADAVPFQRDAQNLHPCGQIGLRQMALFPFFADQRTSDVPAARVVVYLHGVLRGVLKISNIFEISIFRPMKCVNNQQNDCAKGLKRKNVHQILIKEI